MALADPYARPAQSPTPAPTSGARPSNPAQNPPAFADASLPARPRSRPQNTAMQYQRAQIETASPTRLVILLHEGAIRFCQLALEAMTQKDLNAQHVNLLKAQRIIAQLLGTLNRERGGEVAENLFRVYPHMLELLVVANLRDQPQPVQTVQTMLRDLRESWLEVERLTTGAEASQESSAKPSGASPSPAKMAGGPRLGDRNA